MSGQYSDERVSDVRCDDISVILDLADGRMISAPLVWYPRLLRASVAQRRDWTLVEDNFTVTWNAISQKVSSQDLLTGAAAPKIVTDTRSIEVLAIESRADNSFELNKKAYVISDNADARYAPATESPARMTPQYGELVDVLQVQGGWVCILAFGSKGWVEREHLSNVEPAKKAMPTQSLSHASSFEVGSRGGLFTRTKSGFRRYM